MREHHPDIATVDVGLPDIDGYEVLRRLWEFSGSLIIMLSARTGEVDSLHSSPQPGLGRAPASVVD